MKEIRNKEYPHTVMDGNTQQWTVTPGYYPDLPNDDYHGGPALSSTSVKLIASKSGLHYWDAKINPEQDVREPHAAGSPMDALVFGNAYHCMVLEPDTFFDEYVITPELPEGLTLRHKAGRKFMVDFGVENEGKIIINQDDHDRIAAMTAEIRKDVRANKILELGAGIVESSFFGIDEETGVLVKIRPDYLRKDMYIADLKSTICANKDDFERSIYKFGYHISAAMYLDVFKAVTGQDFEGKFIFLAQEKTRPYAIAKFVISDDAIKVGLAEYRRAIRLYAEYTDKFGTDRWPGYEEEIQTVGLPGWAFKKPKH